MHEQTANLLTRALTASDADPEQPHAPQSIQERYKGISTACRLASSAISRQSRDRVGGRFFLPDIIEAAQLQPTGEDYMSEEDPIAIFQPAVRGRRARVAYGTAERLHLVSGKGGKVRDVLVQNMHIMDRDGLCVCAHV